MNNNIFYNAAVNYLKAGEIFKVKTGYGSGKAQELLVSAFVNEWLVLQGDARQLVPTFKPNGVDGYVVVNGINIHGRNEVEIKTLKNGSAFQFARHFLPSGLTHKVSGTVLNPNACGFDTHLLVVCAILKNSAIKTIYIAHGPDVMEELATQLGVDSERPSFIVQRPRQADNPLLYASQNSKRTTRSLTKNIGLPLLYSVPEGLDDLAATHYPFSKTSDVNWVKKFNSGDAEYANIIKTLMPPINTEKL